MYDFGPNPLLAVAQNFEVQSHPWLREIPSAPKKISYLGSQQSLMKPCFAIVGTRKPSIYGVQAAIHFSRELASRGFTIVSGLARGIDSYAHRGAILAKGTTVAVLAHGFDRIYPPENRPLSQQILSTGGCLISEYPQSEPPFPHHFPERNRIISGFCVGTLIVEAAEKSGSLITARFALEQNRELFVIPSRINDKSFKGGNLLLQEGAKMVLKVEDILDELPLNDLSIEPEKKKKKTCFPELKEYFQSHGGTLTLGTLYSAPSSKKQRLTKELERALLEEQAFEISPQLFVWID